MDAVILNKEFKPVYMLDAYESLIWTDRFCACGDFELYTPISYDLIDACKMDYYIYNPDSEHVMIIENMEVNSDVDEGTKLIVTGRSLESILQRRVVWNQTTLTGRPDRCIKKLIEQNIADVETNVIVNRRVPYFIYEEPDTDTIRYLNLIGTIQAQFTGDNLYDAIIAICEPLGLGFKVLLRTVGDYNYFVFKIYSGKDRSYNQTTNSYVIFSPTFENFINSNYRESKENLKTIALIAGEGEGINRRTATTLNPEDTSQIGLARRELFVDARDIQSTYMDDNNEEQTMSDADYTALLKQRGKEKIAECNVTKGYEGSVDFQSMFIYGEDFFLGDTVQLKNEFGIESTGRISEIVFTQDNEGYTIVPTFGSVE